jgi:hypothetical protein
MSIFRRMVLVVSTALAVSLSAAADETDSSAAADGTSRPGSADSPAALSLRGKVVWLADILQRRWGIVSDDDVAHAYCALEAEDGRIYPIVKEARGRGFWRDERIRDIDVELLARPLADAGMIQVIRVYVLKQDGKYELDYWCDVCSIPMFELKACECCQGPTRLRLRRVGAGDQP